MTKRRRPQQHLRLVRTKRGRRRIVVNRGIIRPKERKIFNYISNPKIFMTEFGGAIDFDLSGEIEKFRIIPGTGLGVDIDPDFEVSYHTHPDNKPNPPSPLDVLAFIDDHNQQAEIIFRKGESFTIIKTPKLKDFIKLPIKKRKMIITKFFYERAGLPGWEQHYKKRLEQLGFKVLINKNLKKSIRIPIKPVEP